MAGARSLSDSQLVVRCREGDAEAWNEVVERFARYVYAIAQRGFRLSGADAEDVFQEVFARTYERLGDLRDDGALRPWLAQTTRRLSIDALRRGGREQATGAVPEPVDDVWMAQLDEALSVHQAMDELPDRCQEVLDRFFCRDQSYRTIGAELDIPAGTVASRISRCLARMRELLGKETGEEAVR